MNIQIYGKKFLDYYNQKEGTDYSPFDFFNEIMFPLYFDCPRNKHLFTVTNSLFSQTNKTNTKNFKDKHKRLEIKKNFFDLINDKNFKSTTFIGSYAENIYAVSSFNTPLDIEFEFTKDEYYLTWIGYPLAFGIQGYNLYIPFEKIMYLLFKSHYRYRDLLNSPEYNKYDGMNVFSWNTVFFNNYYSDDDFDLNEFNPFENCSFDNKKHKINFNKKDKDWLKLFHGLSVICENNILTCNIVNYTQVGKNIGFFKLKFGNYKKFIDLCKEYFGNHDYEINSDVYKKILFGSEQIEQILSKGQLGIIPLKINNDVFKWDKMSNKKSQNENFEKLNYYKQIYKLYYGMKTNNDDLFKKMEIYGLELKKTQQKFKKNNTIKNLINIDLFEKSYNKEKFISNLNELIKILKNNNVDIPDSIIELVKYISSLESKTDFKMSKSLIEITYNTSK